MSSEINKPEEKAPDEKELLFSMSQEAINYLNRVIPIFEKIKVDLTLDESKISAKEQLSKSEDGLRWLSIFAHQCLTASDETLDKDTKVLFDGYNEQLSDLMKDMIKGLESKNDQMISDAINDKLIPMFTKIQDLAKLIQNKLTPDPK